MPMYASCESTQPGTSLTYGDDFYGCIVNHDQFVAFDGLNNQTTVFAGFDH
jgi:hypothetical protein